MPEDTFAETHPWITFRADLTKLPSEGWMRLGEARSKVEHLSRALLKPSVASEMHSIWLTKGALATTAIEGNTLTEEQARGVVDNTSRPPPSQEYLATELENIIAACNSIADALHDGGNDGRLSPTVLASLNMEILDGLHLREGDEPGVIPTWIPVVGAYKAVPRGDVKPLLAKLCEWINNDLGMIEPSPDWAVPLAILKAIYAHLYIAWIHPFGDGNGRLARLAEFQILLAAGFPTPAAHLLSNHYNLTRSDYYRYLQEASERRNPEGFVDYAIKGLVDGLAEQLDRVWQQQYDDRWEQFIYESFGGRSTVTDRRRLAVALAVSDEKAPVAVSRIARLTPDLAAEYASKTHKTVSRDLNALIELGLLRRTARGRVEARRDQILAFRARDVLPTP